MSLRDCLELPRKISWNETPFFRLRWSLIVTADLAHKAVPALLGQVMNGFEQFVDLVGHPWFGYRYSELVERRLMNDGYNAPVVERPNFLALLPAILDVLQVFRVGNNLSVRVAWNVISLRVQLIPDGLQKVA